VRVKRGLSGAIVVAAVTLTLAIAGCSGGGDDTTADTGGGKLLPDTASLSIADLTFEPSTLPIARGTTTITITNSDDVDHTFTLDDDSVSKTIPAGSTVDVKVTLDSSIGFHCSIHPQMTGTLQVA
jgi:plastocyanin